MFNNMGIGVLKMEKISSIIIFLLFFVSISAHAVEDLLADPSGKVYAKNGLILHWVEDPDTLKAVKSFTGIHGVRDVSYKRINSYTKGISWRTKISYSGLITHNGGAKVYVFDRGFKRHIPNRTVAKECGYVIEDARPLSSFKFKHIPYGYPVDSSKCP